jgi:hypothetical protein
LGHAVGGRADHDVGGALGLGAAPVRGGGVEADQLGPRRGREPGDGQLPGAGQDRGLHLGDHRGVEVAGRLEQFGGQGPGPRPVQHPVGQRRPRRGQPPGQ